MRDETLNESCGGAPASTVACDADSLDTRELREAQARLMHEGSNDERQSDVLRRDRNAIQDGKTLGDGLSIAASTHRSNLRS